MRDKTAMPSFLFPVGPGVSTLAEPGAEIL
jgi:hypothetical protein